MTNRAKMHHLNPVFGGSSALLLTLLLLTLSPFTQAGRAQTAETADPRPSPGKVKDFQFKGGDVGDLMKAIHNTFGTNLQAVADIPDSMYRVRVPKIRLKTDVYQDVFLVYNEVSEAGRTDMGHWIVAGLNLNPRGVPKAIVLIPPHQAQGTGGEIAVKAFAVKDMSEDQISQIEETIERTAMRLYEETKMGRFPASKAESVLGRIRHHSNTGILIAAGGKAYVELADTIIMAFRENKQKGSKKPSAF